MVSSKAQAAWDLLQKAQGPKPKQGAGVGMSSMLALQSKVITKKKRSENATMGCGGGGIVDKSKAAAAAAAAVKKAATTTATPSVTTSSEDAAAMKAAAVAALKAVGSASGSAQQVVVKSFAGEKVEITGNAAAAAMADKSNAAASAGVKKSGLDSLLSNVVEKKDEAISTMTKTKSDWDAIKKEGGQEMADELEGHKKSGKTYLDRQEFLKKAEWTSYEKDREAQLKAQGVHR